MPYSTIAKKEEWRANNRQRLALNEKNYRDRQHRKAITRLGGKCIRCGITDIRTLQIDHINGGGVKSQKTRRGVQTFNHLLTLPNEELIQTYQLLCANCNWIKKYENKEHPNKKYQY